MSPTLSTPALFRIAPGPVVHATHGLTDSHRFVFEVNYLGHFAGKIGECLGMKKVELGLVEDANSQTAFCYDAEYTAGASVVNGVFAQGHRPPSEVVEELRTD